MAGEGGPEHGPEDGGAILEAGGIARDSRGRVAAGVLDLPVKDEGSEEGQDTVHDHEGS